MGEPARTRAKRPEQFAILVRPYMDMLDRCVLNTCTIAVWRDEAPSAHKWPSLVAVVVGLETARCADGRIKIAAVRLEPLPGVVPEI